MPHKERQIELINFLRTRRARLSPEHVGLPGGMRRRTPGLRREEVAQLANVSVEWYTRLEQGRDIRLSSKALENIAHALTLDDNERLHLFHLVGQEAPPRQCVAEEEVSPSLQRYLDALGTNPAYVLSERWDRLAWNAAACALFEDFSLLSLRERNVVWSLFVNPARRKLHVDWEQIAQSVLAEFRVSYGRYASDPLMRELVEDLQRVSPDFRLWWPRHMTQGSLDGIKLINHPLVGRMALEHHSFVVNGTPTQRVKVYTPLPQYDTLRKLEELLAVNGVKYDDF